MAKNLCGAMVSGATAPDPSFRGFTKPPKHPFPKEKKRFLELPLPKLFFWISP